MSDPASSSGHDSARVSGAITLWVDADSVPRDLRPLLVRRAAARREYEGILVEVRFIAARAPADIPQALLTLVDPGEGAADRAIEERCTVADIVVTRDIPFAERIVASGAHAINDRGDIFTREAVAERRSLRDAMASLREVGIAPPSPRGSRRSSADTKRFADGLERLIVRAVREKRLLLKEHN